MFSKILFSLAVISSSTAFAASESVEALPGTGATVGSTDAARSSVLDHLYINYFGIFHGPGITNIDKPYTPNIQNGHTDPGPNSQMNFDSELTVAYMLTKDIGIGPDLPFFYYPVQGKGFQIGDAGVKAFNKHFIRTPNLNIYANLIVQLPTSDYSRSAIRNQSLGLKMTPNIRYSIPNSRYTIGAWTEQKAYLGVSSGKSFKLYAAPYINYQVTPKFSWNLEFEAEADHFVGKRNFDLQLYSTDLMPGFVYLLTPKILINPYFQIFTSQKVSMQNTALGAVMSATL